MKKVLGWSPSLAETKRNQKLVVLTFPYGSVLAFLPCLWAKLIDRNHWVMDGKTACKMTNSDGTCKDVSSRQWKHPLTRKW